MDANKLRLAELLKEIEALPEVVKTINQYHDHNHTGVLPMLILHLKNRACSIFGYDIGDFEKKETP